MLLIFAPDGPYEFFVGFDDETWTTIFGVTEINTENQLFFEIIRTYKAVARQQTLKYLAVAINIQAEPLSSMPHPQGKGF